MPTNLMEWTEVVQNLVVALAALFGMWVAHLGIDAWQRQLKGSTEYELARRVLKACYRLRESLRGVRNPMMWAQEMKAPPADEAAKMSHEEINAYGSRAGYAARWDKVVDATIDLDQELLEAEAVWGAEIKARCGALHAVRGEIGAAMSFHLRNLSRSVPARSTNYEFIEKQEAILYAMSDDDPTNEKIRAAIKGIEEFLSPHLKR